MNRIGKAEKAVYFICVAFILCAPWSLVGMQICALCGFALSMALWSRNGTPKLNSLDISVLIYLAAVLFSLFSAPDIPFDWLRSTSFWPIVAYWPLREAADRLQKSSKLFTALSGVLTIVSIYAILQAFFGLDIMRPSNPISYPNPGRAAPYAVFGFFDRHHTFAASMGMLTLFCISGLSKNTEKNRLPALVLPALFSTAAVFLAQARAVFIALPFSVAVTAILKIKKQVVYVIVVLMLIVPAALIFLNDTASDRLLHPINSDNARIKIMQIAAVVQSERPLSGWGVGHFYLVADNYFDAMQPDVYVRSGTHNDFMQMLFDGGIPLAFSFMLLIAAIFNHAIKLAFIEQEPLAAGILAAMLIFTIYGLFHNPMADGELSLTFWSLAGLLSGLKKQVSC